MPRVTNLESMTVSQVSMFSGHGFGDMAEMFSSDITEDFPNPGVLANIVFSHDTQIRKGSMTKDELGV